jgi:uncharacterized protein YdeI (YjbR/CyaY-like superfamily)
VNSFGDNSDRMPLKPLFFPSPSAWRAWLEKHHADTTELWIGLYKRESGRSSITWPEAVDGALCFGWIDGIRKSIDETSYKIRFTPRKPRSIWSAANVKRATELSAMGLMHPAGLSAFQNRDGKRTELYSYEQRKGAELPAAYERKFRTNQAAWAFFQAQPPGYKRVCSWWVISAKKEETKLKRLAALIEHSEHQRKIPAMSRPPRS